MRALVLNNRDDVIKELKSIKVDPSAYSLFINKASNLTLKFEKLSSAQTNILKQTALICGADVAIPKIAYQGSKKKHFSAILFANRREAQKIVQRLGEQPWMASICKKLEEILADRKTLTFKIGNREITFDRTYIMGVINVTPDSFYSGSRYTTHSMVEKVVSEIEEEGADFIDVGAESTRPGSDKLTEQEEMERLATILPTLIKNTKVPISVDTYKSKVAAFAIDQGASIINDISGLGFDKKMAKVIARNKVGVVIMHIKGTPKTMQVNPHYDDLMAEIFQYFKKRMEYALDSGIKMNRIVIDPGLGFGKRLDDNYEIIRRLNEFSILNRPIMVGHSRKSFIGKPFNLPPEQRLEGTLGIEALLIENGASILRVHDVAESKKVALLLDRIIR